MTEYPVKCVHVCLYVYMSSIYLCMVGMGWSVFFRDNMLTLCVSDIILVAMPVPTQWL